MSLSKFFYFFEIGNYHQKLFQLKHLIDQNCDAVLQQQDLFFQNIKNQILTKQLEDEIYIEICCVMLKLYQRDQSSKMSLNILDVLNHLLVLEDSKVRQAALQVLKKIKLNAEDLLKLILQLSTFRTAVSQQSSLNIIYFMIQNYSLQKKQLLFIEKNLVFMLFEKLQKIQANILLILHKFYQLIRNDLDFRFNQTQIQLLLIDYFLEQDIPSYYQNFLQQDLYSNLQCLNQNENASKIDKKINNIINSQNNVRLKSVILLSDYFQQEKFLQTGIYLILQKSNYQSDFSEELFFYIKKVIQQIQIQNPLQLEQIISTLQDICIEKQKSTLCNLFLDIKIILIKQDNFDTCIQQCIDFIELFQKQAVFEKFVNSLGHLLTTQKYNIDKNILEKFIYKYSQSKNWKIRYMVLRFLDTLIQYSLVNYESEFISEIFWLYVEDSVPKNFDLFIELIHKIYQIHESEKIKNESIKMLSRWIQSRFIKRRLKFYIALEVWNPVIIQESQIIEIFQQFKNCFLHEQDNYLNQRFKKLVLDHQRFFAFLKENRNYKQVIYIFNQFYIYNTNFTNEQYQ